MTVAVRPRLLLLDFDGVLAHYSHGRRIAHLAIAAGCEHARVADVLFASGLETEYDSGLIDTATYLRRLGDGLGCAIDQAAWIASRAAGNHADTRVIGQVLAVAAHTPIGVLTNNGALMSEAMRAIIAPLFPLLDGRVLCSGALGVRKPDAAIFARALEHFDVPAAHVLFVDDKFVNVQGARAAGLQADTARDARSLRKVLKRHGLVGASAPMPD
ncbi:HAD-IA family hydrolase [Pseudoxanthomonas daejeonensis]|uniref:HAD-IA family hydrolase n=1 Tax=Pseudoxanthomonas daejeonensis TaxID=266062 RepID=UPI001F5411F5|nr:HAD-IA family hydrolase [Pseudoxanthomonas daejeonensis]UNK58227.1 HAD-IA family hydrolase [Pseudoxanthomonas daejeonensis]